MEISIDLLYDKALLLLYSMALATCMTMISTKFYEFYELQIMEVFQ